MEGLAACLFLWQQSKNKLLLLAGRCLLLLLLLLLRAVSVYQAHNKVCVWRITRHWEFGSSSSSTVQLLHPPLLEWHNHQLSLESSLITSLGANVYDIYYLLVIYLFSLLHNNLGCRSWKKCTNHLRNINHLIVSLFWPAASLKLGLFLPFLIKKYWSWDARNVTKKTFHDIWNLRCYKNKDTKLSQT